MPRILLLLTVLLAVFASTAQADPAVRSGTANDTAGLLPVVNQFRDDLGNPNNGTGGTFETGRREINWDGVPDSFIEPFAPDFFNKIAPRGVVLSTPGSGFRISRTAAAGQVRFSNLDPSYAVAFTTFSPQRLLAPIGMPITDVEFRRRPTTSSTATASATRLEDNSGANPDQTDTDGDKQGDAATTPTTTTTGRRPTRTTTGPATSSTAAERRPTPSRPTPTGTRPLPRRRRSPRT